jgi:predicted enzyme related to lactoylglutathione lyase
VEFYSKVFGWKIEKSGPIDYWLATAGKDDEPGINGAISPRSELPATRNTISVPSIEEFADKITKAGGKVVSPKMPIPGFGYLAACVDTEGNAFGIMQADPNAK